LLGTHIGNYRLVTELGGGAMGEVYYAEHTLMGRRAAIKVIREELSRDAAVIERFVNEARAVNAIKHPNIVEITDFGQVGSRYYLIMELLEGETLEARLEREPHLSEQDAIGIATQVCDALSAAHAVGIIHRDLKPENIFLSNRPSGHELVKVLDFGVAKLTQVSGRPNVTTPGMLLGTPHYMSPEQCRGDVELDHRSDVYALGIVLYRMLTGVLPLDSEDLLQLLFKHLNQIPVEVRVVRPEVSIRTEAAVMRALRKIPSDRFPSMGEFRAALLEPLPEPAGLRGPGLPGAATSGPALPAPVPFRPPPPSIAQAPGVAPAVGVVRPPVEPLGPTMNPVVEGKPADPAAAIKDTKQSKRVASKLAWIVLERLKAGRLQLPTLPTSAVRCLEQLREANVSSAQLAETLARDPLLATQVIRRANSVLVAGSARVRSLEVAVGRLGALQLRSTLMELSTRRLFESRNPAIRQAFTELWDHSLGVASIAQQLAVRCAGANSELAYLAGLLHDVGKPVIASLLLEAERQVSSSPEEWLNAANWLEVVAGCHREVGVATARAWQLPDEVIHAIARSNRFTPEGRGATPNLVCFANAIAKSQGLYAGPIELDEVRALVKQGQELYSVTDEQLQLLRAKPREPARRPVPMG
jgi:eukaryotic-like serine/threonine-protein kinase